MAFIALLIGAVLVVAALRNTQDALFSALKTDAPSFAVWAAAIVALGIIGFIPGLKPVSRALLALVFVVIILKNYQTILSGFQSAWQGAAAQGSGSNSKTSTASSGNIFDLPASIGSLIGAGNFGGFAGSQVSDLLHGGLST